MKRLLLVCIATLLWSYYARSQTYQRTEFGIKFAAQWVQTEIQFYSPQIVRVIKSPEGLPFEKKSLSVILQPQKTDLKISIDATKVSLLSSALKVVVDIQTGKIQYFNLKGESLLIDKEYGVQFTPTKDVKKDSYTVRQAFLLDREEAIYGLGQQQNGKLMQRNQRVTLKNDNTKVCIPYLLSLKGYALFLDNYSADTFTDNVQETSFEFLGDGLDYYFMYGNSPQNAAVQMRTLTGQAPMFPLWSYGYWQSRERYKTQKELLEVVEKYRTLKVPLDGIIQDWQYWGKDSLWNRMEWDAATFPDPKAMADKVHQSNAHLMVVAWPGFAPATQQYQEFKSKNMIIDFETWPPKANCKPYDVYNPQARDIYWNYLKKVFAIGVDAWWLDSSEPDHINVKDKDFNQATFLGSYRSVVNAFPLMHTTGVFEHQKADTKDKRVFILTRSAFAGQQRNAANTWSGDVGSSWINLGNQIPAALNFSLSGIPYWNADIGGFFAGGYNKDGGAKNPEFQELYVRWLQFATFTPMMRSHGTDIPREIYQFGNRGDWAFDAIEKNINLRYHLLPYLYSTAWQVTNQSAAIIYALPLLFPADFKVQTITDEFLFGTSILVAPVINPMYSSKKEGKVSADFATVKSRSVYLPKGTDWVDFWTGETLKGGQEVEKNSPIDITPLYVKAGTILPWGEKVQFATEKKWDNLEIRIYQGADGTFTLYEDENDNYNYEKGLFATITFNWNNATKELTINDQKGNFPTMLKKRNFNLVLVNTNNGTGVETSKKITKTVTYIGKAITVKL